MTSKQRAVWVVETWVDPLGWRPFDSRVKRSDARALAREDRKRWPNEKFRTVRYQP